MCLTYSENSKEASGAGMVKAREPEWFPHLALHLPPSGSSPRRGRRPKHEGTSRSCGRSNSWRRTCEATWTGSCRQRTWTSKTPQQMAILVLWLKRAGPATVGNPVGPIPCSTHASDVGYPPQIPPQLATTLGPAPGSSLGHRTRPTLEYPVPRTKTPNNTPPPPWP